MQTVIGLFENVHAARAAAQQLLSNGFASKNVEVSARNDSESSAGYRNYSSNILDRGTPVDPHKSPTMAFTNELASAYRNNKDLNLSRKVSRFFKNLLGSNDEEFDHYLRLANKTGSVVTVHAYSNARVEIAVDILDEYGAIHINEDTTEYA